MRMSLIRQAQRAVSAGQLSFIVPALLFLAAVLPLWAVRYLPLYDYQNHLLEAQVVLQYANPNVDYASHYLIRPDWVWRSNALTTLLFILFGNVMPIELAGKLVVTGYVALLLVGTKLLLKQLQRPHWLLLGVAPLINSLMLTGGMLNAAYAFALTPWLLLSYLRWQQRQRWYQLGLLAVLAGLQYMAHGFGWALTVLILGTLAASDRLPVRQTLLLGVALSSAIPMQLITRPMMSLVPALVLPGCLILAALIRRLHLGQRHVGVLAVGLTGGLLLVIRHYKTVLVEAIPGLDYSLNAKFLSLPRLLTLPFQSATIEEWQIYANLVILILAIIAGIALCWRVEQRWLPVLGILSLALLLTPYRTVDLIVIEPRILLVIMLVLLVASETRGQGAGVRGQGSGIAGQHKPPRIALLSLSLLALLHLTTAAAVALDYDRVAQGWARTMLHIGPGQRIMVLANPSNVPQGSIYNLARLAQVFDPNQFSATYALEHGGFISNTFYNGPLLPRHPNFVPDYWASDFDGSAYLQSNCANIWQGYDMIMAWNANTSLLEQELYSCTGITLKSNTTLTLWQLGNSQ